MTQGIRIWFWRLCGLCRATVINHRKLSCLNNQRVLCHFWRPGVHTQGVSRVMFSSFLVVVIVQLLSRVWLFATPWTVACQASLSITNSRRLLRLMFIEAVMPSNHLILCRLLLFLPTIFPNIRVFSSESCLCIRWPNYWSFSFSISPSSESSGLISFRMDWLDLLAVQGTLSLLGRICSLPLSSILVGPAIFGVPWLAEASLQ